MELNASENYLLLGRFFSRNLMEQNACETKSCIVSDVGKYKFLASDGLVQRLKKEEFDLLSVNYSKKEDLLALVNQADGTSHYLLLTEKGRILYANIELAQNLNKYHKL